MTLREYSLSVARELDNNFLPEEARLNLGEEINKILITDMIDYFTRNIAYEMAAEFIAYKLNLTRKGGVS